MCYITYFYPQQYKNELSVYWCGTILLAPASLYIPPRPPYLTPNTVDAKQPVDSTKSVQGKQGFSGGVDFNSFCDVLCH